MGGRGQISLFVIIGLVLVIAAALFFSLANKSPLEIFDAAPSQEVQMVESAVENCLRRAAPDAIIPFFNQGFFYELPEERVRYEYIVPTDLLALPVITKTEIAPYFKQAFSLVPDEEAFQNNYALFVRDGVKKCFEESTLPGVEFTSGEPFVNAQIGTMTVISLDYPITITKSDGSEEIGDFSFDLEYDMKTKYEFIRGFVEGEVKDFLSIEKISSDAYDNYYTFDLININEDDIAFRIN